MESVESTLKNDLLELRQEAKEASLQAKQLFEENNKHEKSQMNQKKTSQALDIAQEKLVDEIKKEIMLKKEQIESGLSHQLNYSNLTIFDVKGLVPVEIGEHPYCFSKERFYENRHFQNRVRDAFSKIFSNGWLVFFKGRAENTYCIKIVPRIYN